MYRYLNASQYSKEQVDKHIDKDDIEVIKEMKNKHCILDDSQLKDTVATMLDQPGRERILFQKLLKYRHMLIFLKDL